MIITKILSKFDIGTISPYPTLIIVINAKYSDAMYLSEIDEC